MVDICRRGFVSSISRLVIDTGRGLPGGYTGKGTAGMGTGWFFCTLAHTRTLTRQTRTPRRVDMTNMMESEDKANNCYNGLFL